MPGGHSIQKLPLPSSSRKDWKKGKKKHLIKGQEQQASAFTAAHWHSDQVKCTRTVCRCQYTSVGLGVKARWWSIPSLPSSPSSSSSSSSSSTGPRTRAQSIALFPDNGSVLVAFFSNVVSFFLSFVLGNEPNLDCLLCAISFLPLSLSFSVYFPFFLFPSPKQVNTNTENGYHWVECTV